MIRAYLQYPLKFDKLMRGELLKRSSLEESVAQNLHLIITSHLGENLYDEFFGCAIWSYDFDNTITDTRLKDNIKESLISALVNQERRLSGLKVNVTISQAEINSLTTSKRIKKRADIEIVAQLISTGEEFRYFEYFFLGPLSYF